MKVILTGKAEKHDFNPLVAISEELTTLIDEKSLADIGVYLFSDKQYDKRVVYENGISFRRVVVGKTKFSLKTIVGFLQTFLMVFSIFPDVVLTKGGMPSYPVILAARLLKIPIIIHESNSNPDDINLWASKFAYKIAVSFKETAEKFQRDDVIHTGEPILGDLKSPSTVGAHEFLNLEKDIPVIWILNDDHTSNNINNVTEESLAILLDNFQIIHEVGDTFFENFKKLTDAMLIKHKFKYRYHSFDTLNTISVKMIAAIADIAVIRPGSELFNIAHWGIPSLVIPEKESENNNQIRNAYNYARSGSCVVIEENNLNNQSFIFELERIYTNENIKKNMSESSQRFAITDAGKNLAEEIVGIALVHEK